MKSATLAVAALVVLAVVAAMRARSNAYAGPLGGMAGGVASPGGAYNYGLIEWKDGDVRALEAFEASMREKVYDITPTAHPLPLTFLETNSKYVRKSLRV